MSTRNGSKSILGVIAVLAVGTATVAVVRWLGYAADSVSARIVFVASTALGGIAYAGLWFISSKQSLKDFIEDACGTLIGTFTVVGLPFFALKQLSLALFGKPLTFLSCFALALAVGCAVLGWLVWLEPIPDAGDKN